MIDVWDIVATTELSESLKQKDSRLAGKKRGHFSERSNFRSQRVLNFLLKFTKRQWAEQKERKTNTQRVKKLKYNYKSRVRNRGG